jgi:glutaredoxin
MRGCRGPRSIVRLTVYSKPGCHLCDDMKALIHRVIAQRPEAGDLSLEEIDVSTDRELLDRYGLEIPVLLIDGKKVAKYRVSEAELTRLVKARRF